MYHSLQVIPINSLSLIVSINNECGASFIRTSVNWLYAASKALLKYDISQYGYISNFLPPFKVMYTSIKKSLPRKKNAISKKFWFFSGNNIIIWLFIFIFDFIFLYSVGKFFNNVLNRKDFPLGEFFSLLVLYSFIIVVLYI